MFKEQLNHKEGTFMSSWVNKGKHHRRAICLETERMSMGGGWMKADQCEDLCLNHLSIPRTLMVSTKCRALERGGYKGK